MAKKKSGVNPFYLVLVIVGIGFLLTVCAYTVMTVSLDRSSRMPGVAEVESGLIQFMNLHGGKLILGELVVLGIATIGAITTDRFWTTRGTQEQPDRPPQE